MGRFKFVLAVWAIAAFITPAHAQFGYGIRGAGGLRANSIAGSGGLRGNGILGSGGLGGNLIEPNHMPGGAMFGAFGLGRPYGAFPNQRAGGGGSKPFSNYSSQPTVSPYLNLFRNDLNGQSDLNYQTLVRPQLQQQQVNSQLQKQDLQAARKLQSIAAQADFNPSGSRDEFPTGHQTAFSYLGHYFPAPVRHQKPQFNR